MRLPRLLVLALSIAAVPPVAALEVALLVPDPPGANPFWDRTVAAARAAAADLDVDLRVVHSKGNSYSIRKDGLALLDKDPPQALLTGYWYGATDDILEAADARGVRSLVFNSPVAGEARRRLGDPRGRLRHWLGQISPDETRAGAQLLDRLLAGAEARGWAPPLRLLLLGGKTRNNANDLREAGLDRVLKRHPELRLQRRLYAGWSEPLAFDALNSWLDEGNAVQIIWSSGDTMLVGALRALAQHDLEAGRDVLLGGFGWDPAALDAVAEGHIEALAGGHFLEAAWALVLLHDYFAGADFAETLGREVLTEYHFVTADEARRLATRLRAGGFDDIDFTRLSAVHNPALGRPHWPLGEILERWLAEPAPADGASP